MTPPNPDSHGETREHSPTPATLTHAPDGTATHDPNQTVTHDAGTHPEPVTGGARRYDRTRLHAAGGMGRVWVARDSSLGRDVALKELRPDRAAGPAARARFVAEARTTGRLEHPNIVPVYEYAPPEDDRPPFYVMRLVAGRTLAEVGKEYHEKRAAGTATAVEFRELLAAFLGVCNAIAYAHGRGVLHRDLKGANVVLGRYGEVVVLDWGLAKWSGDAPDAVSPADASGQTETTAGTVMGTPSYMAPEQAAGRPDLIDVRTDVYGLGAVLYELLTGRPPFTGPDTASVLLKVQSEVPPAPRSLTPDTPRPLEAICLKAVAKVPADRYDSAGALADDVRRFLADEPVAARPEPVLERVARRLRKNRTLAAALAVAAAVLIPALAVFAEVERRYAKSLGDEQKQTADAKALADARLEQVVDTWYTQLITVQNELDQQGVSPRFRLRVLLAAKDRLADVLRDQPRARATDHMLHVLHRRIADTLRVFGDITGAERELGVARRVADARFRDDPDGPDSRRDVADALIAFAELLHAEGKSGAALAALAEADKHLAVLPADPRAADDRVSLAERRVRMLMAAKRPATAAAAEAVRAARENAAKRPDHAHAQTLLLQALHAGVAEAHTRRASGADFLTEALTHAEAQRKRDDTPGLVADRAALLVLRGEDAVVTNDVPAARGWFQKALAVRADLARRADVSPDAVLDLAAVYRRLGDLSYNAKQYPDAVTEYGEAARYLGRVLVANPTRSARRMQGDVLARLGALETALGHAAEAREHLTRCEAIRAALAADAPEDAEARFALAQSHRLLADLEKSPAVLQFDEAERHYQKAVELAGGVKPGDQFTADADYGARYCRSVLDVIADPAKAPADPNTAYPLFIARMRVQAKAGDAAGAVKTGETVRRLSPKHPSYIEAEARGRALALSVEKAAAAKDAHARAAIQLLAEAGHGTNTPADADFAALRAFRTPPIPTAGE